MQQQVMATHVSNEHNANRQRAQLSIEELLILSQNLSGPDRALLKGVYERGMSASAIAALMGLSPNTVQRRLRKLALRVTSPCFRYVVKHRLDWPDIRRAVAEGIVLRGQSQRSMAQALDVSIHRVRCEIDRVRIMCESASRR